MFSFFMLKMPRYSCKWVLREKLRYACYFCNTINLDDYSHVPAAAATYGTLSATLGPLSPSSPRTAQSGATARLGIAGAGELPTGIDDEVSPSDSEGEGGGSFQTAIPTRANSEMANAGRLQTTAIPPTFRSVEMATRQEYGAPKAEARHVADLNGATAGGDARVAGDTSSSHTEILENSQHLLRMLSEMDSIIAHSHSNREDPPASPPFFHSPPLVRSPSPFANLYRTAHPFQPPAPPNLLSLAASRPNPAPSDSNRSNLFLQQIGGPPVLQPHELLSASDREGLAGQRERFFRFGGDRPSAPSAFGTTQSSGSRPRLPIILPIDSDDDLNL